MSEVGIPPPWERHRARVEPDREFRTSRPLGPSIKASLTWANRSELAIEPQWDPYLQAPGPLGTHIVVSA